MNFRKSKTYVQDLITSCNHIKNMERLKNKSICISGATGLIGSFIVDILLEYNTIAQANITIYAMGRSKERFTERFGNESFNLVFLQHDVCYPLESDFEFQYIIHAASNAYPKVIVNDPVGTIMANISGTKELLEYGRHHGMIKFLYVSSGEVYGEIDNESNAYKEDFCGYINTLDARSCYPISKRTAENLCISYAKQYGIDVSIVRPSHTYGPNFIQDDNRATVQFVNNILKGENIVLKSSGSQLRSYTYIADCASAILFVLLHGTNCEAYNISNSNSIVNIADFAKILAQLENKEVTFTEPDKAETAQRSPFSKQVLCSDKLEQLGWNGDFDINKGIQKTITILKEIKEF